MAHVIVMQEAQIMFRSDYYNPIISIYILYTKLETYFS